MINTHFLINQYCDKVQQLTRLYKKLYDKGRSTATFLSILFICLSIFIPNQSDGAEDLLITNARLIDGTGSSPLEKCSVYIRDGRIASIGENISIQNVRVLDAAGATILPGLIDAHVHLQSVPGTAYRKDDNAKRKKFRHHHLRAYLACGVTTVLDNAISSSVLRELHRYLNEGGVGPNIYALAPAFYAPHGYLDGGMLTPYWGPMWRATASPEDVTALFTEYAGIPNIVGVKMFIEYGFGPFKIWKVHSPEMRTIINKEAGKRNLPIYVHAYSKKEFNVGLEMNVHNFVHSGFNHNSPSDKLIQQVKAKGAYLLELVQNIRLNRVNSFFLIVQTFPEITSLLVQIKVRIMQTR